MSFVTDIDGNEVAPETTEEVSTEDTTESPVAEEYTEESTEQEPEDEEPTAAPVLTNSERQQFEQLKQAQQQQTLQNIAQQIQQEAQQQYRDTLTELIREGYSEQAAQRLATKFGEQHLASRQRELQTALQLYQHRQTQNIASEQRSQIAKEYKIAASDLEAFTDPAQMRAHAALLKRVNDAERVARGNRRQTPAQRFEGAATEQGSSMDSASLLAALGDERMDPSQLTDEQIARMLRD